MSTKAQAQQSESNTPRHAAETDTTRSEERVEIEAAKLRVLVNERLKRPTEPWIVELSQRKL